MNSHSTLVALLVLAGPASSQTLLQRLQPATPTPGAVFGSELALEGGQVLALEQSLSVTGNLLLFDAISGTELWSTDVSLPGAVQAQEIALGVTSAFVGAPEATASGGNSGVVQAYARGSGALAYTLEAPSNLSVQNFGYALAVGDGILAVGDPTTANNAGGVLLYEEATGALLGGLGAPPGASNFGASLDIDAGRIIVGAPTSLSGSSLFFILGGSAFVYDLADLSAPIGSLDSPVPFPSLGNLGMRVALTDGFPTAWGTSSFGYSTNYTLAFGTTDWPAESEVNPAESVLEGGFVTSLAGSNGRTLAGARALVSQFESTGRVTVIEAGRGQPLYRLESPDLAGVTQFGARIAADGDLAAIADLTAPTLGTGTVYVYDTRPKLPSIIEAIPGLSVTPGLDLILRDEPASAGSLYLLLGTLSGTQPGVVLDGVPVPLNVDSMTSLTFTKANAPFLENTLGTWGADPFEESLVGPFTSAFVGEVLDLVLLTVDPSGIPTVSAASQPYTLTF